MQEADNKVWVLKFETRVLKAEKHVCTEDDRKMIDDQWLMSFISEE
jgi:hypothetical protein